MAGKGSERFSGRFLTRGETSAFAHMADGYPMPSEGLGRPPISDRLYDHAVNLAVAMHIGDRGEPHEHARTIGVAQPPLDMALRIEFCRYLIDALHALVQPV